MDTTHFKPGSELTFQSVVSIHSMLHKTLMNADGTKFCLDLTEVVRCDSAGLALLLDARKLCHRHKKVFEIKGMSPETLSLAEFCGVKNILEAV